MKTRKTVELTKLLEMANHYFACESPHITAANRIGASIMLEAALSAANAYAGFNYLPKWGHEIDESRRVYFTHQNLRD